MTLQAGDREFGHGDQLTVVNNTGGALDEGTAVYVSGRDGDHPEVTVATSAGESDGVLADSVANGETVQVVLHGLVWVPVDATVDAGVTVDETANGVFTGNAQSGTYRVYEGGDSIALIRYEN